MTLSGSQATEILHSTSEFALGGFHQIEPDANGYIIFDDSVLDKRYSQEIEMVRRQYSGNEHGIIKGIGVVSCVYVNPKVQRFWVIDYRIFNPDVDGKTKIDHVKDMLQNLVYQKLLPFDTVLMDTWYAVHSLMLYIDSLEKVYYCPLKNNRRVDDTWGQEKYTGLTQNISQTFFPSCSSFLLPKGEASANVVHSFVSCA
ncbi:hypothetical protein PN488_03625 [Nodularia spumigena CS-591/12]|uniref:Transposase IS701-like DDE domain-containing protein n=1 Tax=Nodularia spumigena CENA596 TaxID=1819295 RepID=A0A161VNB7_NODSP|nr:MULTISPECIES: hypothetical protein [Cyanophyceae]MDB9358677.1 hypothetical protein [Nodularia spumigena CS-587/03]KZL48325.1 hypothetical protein A2T98_18555 [Nodularia spumigena CENA596]MDB9303478.1 hypothetical protein [Nodularia spumigena CS-591/12]MDB9318350.1 hypothetical protein [Nodularia spumigena CS-590/01A]MDB9323736.1 hypothetical protein [Nodularia spumigena CS-591/07A]